MTGAEFETLVLRLEAPVATIVVNRPDKRNALNAQVRRELLAALDRLRHEPAVRVIVLAGAGDKAFVAGADIAEFAARSPLEQRDAMEARRVFEELAAFPKPTIAMVNGFALGGGCELALACDLRVAARSARFGQPEIRLGLIPGGGGTQRLPRLIGPGAAARLVFTGDLIGAEEAERLGLVDVLAEDDALEETTMGLARRIAAQSPVALRLAKEALRAGIELPMHAGLKLERELFVTAFGSADGREGVRAFLEKRDPEFTGT
jgi:enoyl-CoA hydratase